MKIIRSSDLLISEHTIKHNNESYCRKEFSGGIISWFPTSYDGDVMTWS